MLLAWIYHAEGPEMLRQFLEMIVESPTVTRQQLERYATEHRARNMVELAEIVEEYAAKRPDAWDLRFMPSYAASNPEHWQAATGATAIGLGLVLALALTPTAAPTAIGCTATTIVAG
jgi:hypothetical protein